MKTFKTGVLPYIIVLGLVAGLMMMQPHLSGTILICLIGAVMMFVGGTKMTHLVGIVIVGIVALIGVVIYKIEYEGISYFTTSWS